MMKAEVRKISEDYAENDLVPEFMGGPYDDNKIIEIMHNNIVGLAEFNMADNPKISVIYKELLADVDKLRTLVVGSGDEIQTSLEIQQNVELDKNIELSKNIELTKNINYSIFANDECHEFIKKFCILTNILINIHDNCDGCKIRNGTRFFNTMFDEYKINKKLHYFWKIMQLLFLIYFNYYDSVVFCFAFS